MGDDLCLNGCGGDAADSTRSISVSFNEGGTGERRVSSPESSLPPLPEPVAIPPVSIPVQPSPALQEPSGEDYRQPCDLRQKSVSTFHAGILQEGCYYMRLIPTSLHIPARFQYEGTLRIQRTGGTIIASGDLYKKDFCKSPTFCPSLSDTNDRQNSIPVFQRKHYAYYLRVTRIRVNPETGRDMVLEMEPHRFEYSNHTWSKRELLTAEVKYSIGPDGIHYWRGDIQTQSEVVLGQMLLVRIAPYLRQAVIEIDRVAVSECPLENEKGEDWQSVFTKAGWDVAVEVSDKDVEEPEDHSWSNAELHQKMLKYRESVDLDKQWRYHLLAVRELDDRAFGMMYDNTIYGVNDIPREGAAIASHVLFPDENCWGKCKGKRFGESTVPYFRTAIHEIGHAMMLYHPDNPYENYIMQKTVQVAHNAALPQQFPENIEWSFSPRDTHLLCHLPDIAIRPGGVSFGTPHHRMPVNARDEIIEAEGLELQVSALHDVVPIGAPVRVNFSLFNHSDQEKLVPGSLSMKTGHVSGKVIDPLGATQDFATIIHYAADVMPQTLPPDECMSHSVTLLWGTEGPLFPTSGYYRIVLELNWHLEGVRTRIFGSTSVMITPPKDDEHARAVLKIFSTPDTLLALTIGGDHMKKGYDVIRTAINHPALRPHFNLMEAKRVGQRYFGRKPSLKETADIVDEDTVMSPAEVIRLTKILGNFARETEKEVVEKMSKTLLFKAKEVAVEDKVVTMLKEIQEQLEGETD